MPASARHPSPALSPDYQKPNSPVHPSTTLPHPIHPCASHPPVPHPSRQSLPPVRTVDIPPSRDRLRTVGNPIRVDRGSASFSPPLIFCLRPPTKSSSDSSSHVLLSHAIIAAQYCVPQHPRSFTTAPLYSTTSPFPTTPGRSRDLRCSDPTVLTQLHRQEAATAAAADADKKLHAPGAEPAVRAAAQSRERD